MEQLGLEKGNDEIKDFFKSSTKMYLLESRTNGYVKTAKFIKILKELQDENKTFMKQEEDDDKPLDEVLNVNVDW